MKTMSQVARLSDCPETMDEARGLITQLEQQVSGLKGALELGQINCDAEYERLREERNEAQAELAALRTEYTELQASRDRAMELNRTQSEELAVLRADKARLDLIESLGSTLMVRHYVGGDIAITGRANGMFVDGRGSTLRAAIDAALAGKEGK